MSETPFSVFIFIPGKTGNCEGSTFFQTHFLDSNFTSPLEAISPRGRPICLASATRVWNPLVINKKETQKRYTQTLKENPRFMRSPSRMLNMLYFLVKYSFAPLQSIR